MKASDFKDFDSWKRFEAKTKCINAILTYKLSIEMLRKLGMKIWGGIAMELVIAFVTGVAVAIYLARDETLEERREREWRNRKNCSRRLRSCWRRAWDAER